MDSKIEIINRLLTPMRGVSSCLKSQTFVKSVKIEVKAFRSFKFISLRFFGNPSIGETKCSTPCSTRKLLYRMANPISLNSFVKLRVRSFPGFVRIHVRVRSHGKECAQVRVRTSDSKFMSEFDELCCRMKNLR